MIKPATFFKATATTLTACILAACGGDSSSSSNSTHTMTLTAPTMGAVEGKSVYTLNIQDQDSIPIVDASPKISPLMTMVSGMQHSTPESGCTDTDAEGNAQCTVYFLMPSQMMMAKDKVMKMGEWELDFTLEDNDQEIISIPTTVGMAMNGPAKVTMLGDDNDKISFTSNVSDITTEENRKYYLFNNGIMPMEGTHSVELFIAAKESMMSFPTLASGTVLSEGTNNELTVSSMSVRVSTDNTVWTTATSLTEGLWKAAGLENYTDKLYVKLTVNGEEKTNNSEFYAVFTATPAMKM